MRKQEYGKVAVIMGGRSSEREISLMSGEAVLRALTTSGVDAHKFDPLENSITDLVNYGYERAVVMLHGRGGEDGTIQGVLDALGILYTGSGVMASSIAMDKYRTKLIWNSIGIPTPKMQRLARDGFDYEAFELCISMPVVVKPCCEGSTLGLSKVYKLDDLRAAIEHAFELDTHILIEKMVEGSEFALTMDDKMCYPLVKIEAPSADYDYYHKYFSDDTNYICPYILNEQLMANINRYGRLAYKSIGVSGVVRVDFIVDRDKQPYFLEINTIPGMTAHSLTPMAYKAAGYSFEELCMHILDLATLHLVKPIFSEKLVVSQSKGCVTNK